MERHKLSLILSEANSFDRQTVQFFFDNIFQVIKRYCSPPESICNENETGCCTVQKPFTIVASKGVKQISFVKLADQGSLVTMIATINALGITIPANFIFLRVNF